MVIICDDREPKLYDHISKFVSPGNAIKMRLHADNSQGKSGDFIITSSPPMIIERKTWGDMVSSWFKGRLQDQMKGMYNTVVGDQKAVPYVIVEGSLAAYLKFAKRVDPKTVAGIIASIAGAWNVRLIPSASMTMTAYILQSLDSQMSRKDVDTTKLYVHTAEVSDSDSRLNILACVPGIGKLNACKLLITGKSIINIVNMTEAELQDILGTKTGTKAYNAFNDDGGLELYKKYVTEHIRGERAT